MDALNFLKHQHREVEALFERLEVSVAYEEHALVKNVIEGLERLDPAQEEYEAKLRVLMDLVQHHVDEEEGTMFKIAHKFFTKEELEELGNRLSQAAAAEVPAS